MPLTTCPRRPTTTVSRNSAGSTTGGTFKAQRDLSAWIGKWRGKYLRLIRALCVETRETWLEDKRYLNMALLAEQKKELLRLAPRCRYRAGQPCAASTAQTESTNYLIIIFAQLDTQLTYE